MSNLSHLFRLPYERQHTSQNGEDGIFEYFIPYINNRTFLEIGWGNGLVNNCRNLLENHAFTGTGVDLLENKNNNLQKHLRKRINLSEDDTKLLIEQEGLYPGVFSLDIDSIDYWVLSNLLEFGFRPEILCHEYNSVWGPTDKVVRMSESYYDKVFNYGASLSAFKELLDPFYTFVTVDSIGINAFYIRSDKRFELPTETIDFQFIQRGDPRKIEAKKSNIDDRWLYIS